MSDLHASDLAPGLFLGARVELGDGLDLGAHVVIHDGVSVGAGCTIQDGAVIGKPPKLGPRSRMPGEGGATRLEPGATVCSHAVVCAGALIRAGAIVGDHCFVRERADIGPGSVLGHGSAIGPSVEIGERVRIWNNVVLAPGTTIEAEVDFAIGAVTTSRRWEPGGEPGEVVVRRGAKVGVRATLLAGVEVGEGAVVGAGSLVNADVPPGAVVAGTPAKPVRK